MNEKELIEGLRKISTTPSLSEAQQIAIKLLAEIDMALTALNDPTQHGFVSVIEVEKLLCEKLGISWSAAGISIVSLIDQLAEAQASQAAQVAGLREALDLVLPLAKGYVAKNNVGSNRRCIEVADAALAAAEGAKG